MKAITTGAVAALLLTSLAGCGTHGVMVPATRSTVVTAQATDVLKAAFPRIHKAIFTSMDVNKDGWLTPDEATKHMSAADFDKADKAKGWGSAGRLSRAEFVEWATKTILWFNDDAAAFAKRFRKDLGNVFTKLDENKDGLLGKRELSIRDLAKHHLTFTYDKLNIQVAIEKVPADKVAGADQTGDGNLSPAEFESLYVEMVIEALGGEGNEPPAPPAPSPAPAGL
jgi:Ca2+-binding EF-hand superfamily protein